MVKLDLEINELIGLAEYGKIGKEKLSKFLSSASKAELETYILESTFADEEAIEEPELDEEKEDLRI